MTYLRKLLLTASVACLGVFLMAGTAFAAPTPADVVEGGATSIVDELVAILTALLPVIAPLAAIVIGWRLARRFIKV